MEKYLDPKVLSYYNQDIYAKTAASVLYDFSKEGSLKKITEAKEILLKKHVHNVVVKNAIYFFLYKLDPTQLEKNARKKHQELIKKLNQANKKVAIHTAKKIKPGSTVFAHSLNNQVFEALLEAVKYKEFRINLLDHEPFSLGKSAAKKLKKQGITLNTFPDISLNHAIQEADLCLIGGEAIIKEGAIVKQGSKIVTAQAKKHQIPVYVCAHSLKYDFEGSTTMLQHEHNHTDHHHKKVYEFLDKKEFYAYVCEYGIFKPQYIVNEVLFHNKWMIR